MQGGGEGGGVGLILRHKQGSVDCERNALL